MGINERYWADRIAERVDLTTTLTHLTKGTSTMDPLSVLLKILKEQKLIGSTNSGFIQGNDRAVCFQDAPLSGVSQNVFHEEKLIRDNKINHIRYQAFGLVFPKIYAFNKGARPVIYEQKHLAKEKFPDELWRVVSYDLSNGQSIIDWTHEREWRIKGDFEFDLRAVSVILPNEEVYRAFIKRADSYVLDIIAGINISSSTLF